jgi:hypothetical protein
MIEDSQIHGNRLALNDQGIIMYWGNLNLFYGNTFVLNDEIGLNMAGGNVNTIYGNDFSMNGINAWEGTESNGNQWNLSNVGNSWDDFSTNPYWPQYYLIAGPGAGVDWHPDGAQPSAVDPSTSYINLTHVNMPGLTTCPKGDGPQYRFIQIHVKDASGQPLPNISAWNIVLEGTPVEPTYYYRNFELNLTPWDLQTDSLGKIRYTLRGNTSIYGNISWTAIVQGVELNSHPVLRVKTFDYDLSGMVGLGDFTLFARDYTHVVYRSDFDFNGVVGLSDFTLFGGHYSHRHPLAGREQAPKISFNQGTGCFKVQGQKEICPEK